MLPAFGRQHRGLMEILTSVKRLYIRFKSLVNDFVYSFGRAAVVAGRSVEPYRSRTGTP